MSDAIARDATPHPRHGIRRRPASSASPQHPDDSRPHSEDEDDDDESDLNGSHATQRKPTTPGSTPGFPLSIFGHPPSPQDTAATVITTTTTTTTSSSNLASRRARKERHARGDSLDSSGSNFDDDDDDDDNDDGHPLDPERANRRQRRRRRRISTSASHLLAQAPPVPDLRFDHNYRKALDQIYETHAQESARAAAAAAAATASAEGDLSESSLQQHQQQQQQQQQHPVRVPSIAARITVMTLRDIIIMPFVHGFFWGFGTVLLTLVGQRTLSYHVQRTWKRLVGGNPDDTPLVTRGEPARVRTTGSGGGGFGGLGLMNAGSGFGKQSSFGRSSTHTAY